MDEPTSGGSWRVRAYPWYAAVLFLLVYLCSSIDRLVISVVVEPLKHAFHLSDAEIGILGGVAFSAPFALASLPVGWLVDRVNRCLLMAVMLIVWSLATMLGALPMAYGLLLGCRMLVGAAEAGAHPASLSLIADYFPPGRRTTAVSLFAVGPALATFVVYLLGGWLQLHYSWHAVFLIAGIPGMLLGVVIALTLREPPRGRYDGVGGAPAIPHRKPSPRETVALLFRTPSLMHAIMGHMLATGAQWSITSWIVSFLVRVHDVSHAQAAIWVGIAMGVCQTIGSLLAGPIVDRLGRGATGTIAAWLVGMTMLCCGTGLAMVLAPTVPLALAGLCAETLCMGMLLGPSYSLLVATSPTMARGSMLSFARLAGTLIGNSGLAFLAGWVSDRVGGAHSIRAGLITTMLCFLWAGFHYRLAGRVRPVSAGPTKLVKPLA
jgi:MFS family permease